MRTNTWVAWELVVPYCSGGVGRFAVPQAAAAGATPDECILNYRGNQGMGAHDPIPDGVQVTLLSSPPAIVRLA